jgi:hypothetical protein
MTTADKPVLPSQTIDFTVPNPSATAQLSLPLYQGAGYRADFKTWALLRNGGFMKFNLRVGQAIPVLLQGSLCASLVDGKANCPISITVNGRTFVASYADTNPNFHPMSWTIPEDMIVAGDNTIVFQLLDSASTQLFINAMGAASAVLPSQGIDFTVPQPKASAQLSLPLYQGAGYRSDFKTWSLVEGGGFMKFNLKISEAVPVELGLTVCASLTGGKANCPISIRVNGRDFLARYDDQDPHFHPVSWTIPSSLLQSGDNEIRVTLLGEATTQLFISHAAVTG